MTINPRCDVMIVPTRQARGRMWRDCGGRTLFTRRRGEAEKDSGTFVPPLEEILRQPFALHASASRLARVNLSPCMRRPLALHASASRVACVGLSRCTRRPLALHASASRVACVGLSPCARRPFALHASTSRVACGGLSPCMRQPSRIDIRPFASFALLNDQFASGSRERTRSFPDIAALPPKFARPDADSFTSIRDENLLSTRTS